MSGVFRPQFFLPPRRKLFIPPSNRLWRPDDASYTKVFWHDAQDYSTITESSNLVTAWNDKFSSANHTSASGSERPTYNSANSNLNNLPTIGVNAAGPILRRATSIGGNRAVFVNTVTAGVPRFGVYATLSPSFTLSTAVIFSTVFPNGTWTVNSPSVCWINGTSGTDVADGSNNNTTGAGAHFFVAYIRGNLSGVTSGRIFDNPTGSIFARVLTGSTSDRGVDLDMGECIQVSGTVTSGDREKFEGYLAHRWGLTGNLGSGHPYKNYAPRV